MELSYLDTVRLLGLDIALMVIVVLFALAALTARLALDPAEPVGRWLLARRRAKRLRSAGIVVMLTNSANISAPIRIMNSIAVVRADSRRAA